LVAAVGVGPPKVNTIVDVPAVDHEPGGVAEDTHGDVNTDPAQQGGGAADKDVDESASRAWSSLRRDEARCRRVAVYIVWVSALSPPIAAPLGDVTTERLMLRRFERDDVDELASVFEQREVWQFPYGRGMTRDETEVFLDAQIAHWKQHEFGCWTAREIASQRLIGYLGLSVPTFLPEILPAIEVGWRLAPSAWGNGYATEGAGAALHEAFTTLGLDWVCSLPQADNPRSGRVAERLGMQLIREVNVPANARRGEVVAQHYQIDRSDWLAVHGSPPVGK
jgi:RimJ/RimL family protein N-acetyltransferase